MKILFNNQPLEVIEPLSITDLLKELKHDQPGSALAINQTIIPRTAWTTHLIQDKDNILLFQAIAGG